MNILILGAGQVGSELTEILSEDGHSITLVDLNEEKLEKESEQHTILKLCVVIVAIHKLSKTQIFKIQNWLLP